MRTPEEASTQILMHTEPGRETESVPLLEAAGRVLAQEVVSDVDAPPFEKAAMDGFALRAGDLVARETELGVVGESRAGHPFGDSVPPASCVAISTGAEVPADCDAVVMVEQTERRGETVRFTADVIEGQNICNRGQDLRVGERVQTPGRRLTATDLSVLAAVGCEPVTVYRRPVVTLLTTGDELVPPSGTPGVGQIREGNTLHLAALARRAGADVRHAGLVRDDQDELAARFAEALDASDVVVTTGGVSMGEHDLVAAAFQACGVEEVFHKIAIKPGKPLWFGKRGRTLVFGLPGNPVSCLLDHEVFVRPALRKLEGQAEADWVEPLGHGRWNGKAPRPNPRQQNLPATIEVGQDGVDVLTPIGWSGSADIVGLATATAMAVVPPHETVEPGERVQYRRLY
jgi:molybdopterin molybdotransferase